VSRQLQPSRRICLLGGVRTQISEPAGSGGPHSPIGVVTFQALPHPLCYATQYAQFTLYVRFTEQHSTRDLLVRVTAYTPRRIYGQPLLHFRKKRPCVNMIHDGLDCTRLSCSKWSWSRASLPPHLSKRLRRRSPRTGPSCRGRAA